MIFSEALAFLDNTDRIRLVHNGRLEFANYKAFLVNPHDNKEPRMKEYGITGEELVKKYRAVLEVRSNDWERKELSPPMLPEETPQYRFSDLQVNMWYEIEI